MGILILPYWLVAIVIGITAIVKVFNFIIKMQITGTQAAFGLLISIAIFALIALSYIIEKKVYALDPPFRIPFYMVILPFIIALAIQKNYGSYSIPLLLSASISAVLIVVF